MFPYLMTGAAIAGGIYFSYKQCCERKKSSETFYLIPNTETSFDFNQMPATSQPSNEQDDVTALHRALSATLVLFQNEQFLKEEGLFRLSGDLTKAKTVYTLMKRMPINYLDQPDPHNAISTLKLALEGSFNSSHFCTSLLNEKLIQTPQRSATLFKEHIQYLLSINKTKEACILHNMLYLMHRIYEFRSFNKAGPQNEGADSNIAIILSPKFMKFLGMPEACNLFDPIYNDNKQKVSKIIDALVIEPWFAKPFHDYVKLQTASPRSTPR